MCFPFFKDMVVLYVPKREQKGGALCITSRDYYMSLPAPKVVSENSLKEIKDLTPHTVMF